MELKHHLDLTGAYEKAKQLELEDERIEEEKRLYLQRIHLEDDPFIFLRIEIEREEQKLKDLKKELYEAEAELKRLEWERRGIRFVESSSGSEIKFLGRP